MEEKCQLEYFLWGYIIKNRYDSINTIDCVLVFFQQYIRYTGNHGPSPAVTQYFSRVKSTLLISLLYQFSPCMVIFFFWSENHDGETVFV